MFDGLGQASNIRRAQTTIPSSKRDHYANLNQQRHQERGREEKDDSPRGAAGGGKGHVMFVEKNMPSIVGVLGDVDRLYRPEVAERLFGPPEVEADPMQIAHGRHQATERSKNASGERVQIKAYNSNNQMALPPRPRAAAAAAAAGGTSASVNFFASATPGTRGEVNSSSSVRGGGDGNSISNAAGNVTTDVNRISTRRAGALPAHELRKLQHRAQLLEHQLHTCTNTIHNREAEIQILQGLRDLHIAKKKTRLGYQVSSYETLHRQVRRAVTATAAAPPPLSSSVSPTVGQPADNQNSSITTGRVKSFVDHFTHHAAERAVNHNRLTQQHAVPIFSAGAGLPGDTDGFAAPERHRRGGAVVRQETMTAPADVLATTNSNTAASTDATAVAGPRHRESAQWRQAPSLNARALMDRVAVPPVRCHTSHLPVGPRHFPHLQSTLAPFAAQDQQPMPQRRDLAPARITSPALWLQRQAHQSVSDFNKAIVFTPNLRRDPMPIRTNTIPLVAAKQQQRQQTPPPQTPTEEGSA